MDRQRELLHLPIPASFLDSPQWARLEHVVSLGYFQESLRAHWEKSVKPVVPTDQTAGEDIIRLTDGSLVYGRALREATEESVENHVRLYVSGKAMYSLEGYTELDGRAEQALEALVSHLRQQGKSVILFLPPYHPLTYARLREAPRYHNVREAERWFRDLGARNACAVLGSFDPGACGFTSGDFYDEMHAKKDALARILAAASPGPTIGCR